MNFDLKEYYKQAHSGDPVKNDALLDYIKSFDEVYLWGASYLGKAVGKYLLDHNVPFNAYWDKRWQELGEVNGVKVIPPFTCGVDKNKVLVLYCIGNNVIRFVVLEELKNEGFNNVIRGDYIYMGAICPFDKTTGITANVCQGTMCCRSIFCERLSNIVKSANASPDPLHMFSITVIVNQKCSLKCKCCTSYMNEYKPEERINIPVERVLKDIDLFFDAMDSLGTVTVMGGEPFMHPDIAKIVRHLLTKKNFGLVSIATSGTYPIKPKMLEGMDDPRVNISFSNYENTIHPNLVKNMYESIETVKNVGINYTVGVPMPEWAVPSTLYNLNEPKEKNIWKKRVCIQPPRCMQIKNGRLHPCDFGTATWSLGICQTEDTSLNLDEAEDTPDLKEKISDFINQPTYGACAHCNFMSGSTSIAAEQGYMDFTKALTQN